MSAARPKKGTEMPSTTDHTSASTRIAPKKTVKSKEVVENSDEEEDIQPRMRKTQLGSASATGRKRAVKDSAVDSDGEDEAPRRIRKIQSDTSGRATEKKTVKAKNTVEESDDDEEPASRRIRKAKVTTLEDSDDEEPETVITKRRVNKKKVSHTDDESDGATAVKTAAKTTVSSKRPIQKTTTEGKRRIDIEISSTDEPMNGAGMAPIVTRDEEIPLRKKAKISTQPKTPAASNISAPPPAAPKKKVTAAQVVKTSAQTTSTPTRAPETKKVAEKEKPRRASSGEESSDETSKPKKRVSTGKKTATSTVGAGKKRAAPEPSSEEDSGKEDKKDKEPPSKKSKQTKALEKATEKSTIRVIVSADVDPAKKTASKKTSASTTSGAKGRKVVKVSELEFEDAMELLTAKRELLANEPEAQWKTYTDELNKHTLGYALVHMGNDPSEPIENTRVYWVIKKFNGRDVRDSNRDILWEGTNQGANLFNRYVENAIFAAIKRSDIDVSTLTTEVNGPFERARFRFPSGEQERIKALLLNGLHRYALERERVIPDIKKKLSDVQDMLSSSTWGSEAYQRLTEERDFYREELAEKSFWVVKFFDYDSIQASEMAAEILATAASNRRLPTINETTSDKLHHMLAAVHPSATGTGPTPAFCSLLSAAFSQMIGNTAGSMARNIYNNPHLIFALAPLARYPLFNGKAGKAKWSSEKALEQTALHTGELLGPIITTSMTNAQLLASEVLRAAPSIEEYQAATLQERNHILDNLWVEFKYQANSPISPPVVLAALDKVFTTNLLPHFFDEFGAKRGSSTAVDWAARLATAFDDMLTNLRTQISKNKADAVLMTPFIADLPKTIFYTYQTPLLTRSKNPNILQLGTPVFPLTEGFLGVLITLFGPASCKKGAVFWRLAHKLIPSLVEFKTLSRRSGPEWTLLMDTVCARNPTINRSSLRTQLTKIYIESQQRGWAELTEMLANEPLLPAPENIGALFNLSDAEYQSLVDAIKRVVHMHMIPSVEAQYSATRRFELLDEDFGAVEKTLNSSAAYDLYLLIRTMLEASGSQWYLYAPHSTTPRTRQEDTCVDEILSVIAWQPFLRRARRLPLISELCQRVLLACSPDTPDYVMIYSAGWDEFDYSPAAEFVSISEAEARQQGEERRERAQFVQFIRSVDRLLDTSLLHIPGSGLFSEEIVGARAQLVKAIYLMFARRCALLRNPDTNVMNFDLTWAEQHLDAGVLVRDSALPSEVKSYFEGIATKVRTERARALPSIEASQSSSQTVVADIAPTTFSQEVAAELERGQVGEGQHDTSEYEDDEEADEDLKNEKGGTTRDVESEDNEDDEDDEAMEQVA